MRPETSRLSYPKPDDGTAQLLRAGLWILLVGCLAALFTTTLGGGIERHGPHTNSGWLALILAMMCLPFGAMLTVLGAAKWLRNRRLAQRDS
jgi:drug/metabolite transporter (DMT)-like permease